MLPKTCLGSSGHCEDEVDCLWDVAAGRAALRNDQICQKQTHLTAAETPSRGGAYSGTRVPVDGGDWDPK